MFGAGAFQSTPVYYYVSLFLAMIACVIIGINANAKFERNNPSSPDDGVGKKLLRAAGRHTIFFIPMEYAAIAIPIVGYLVKQYLF